MLTKQDFLDAGYKVFHQSKETIKMADFGLQKCIRDEIGKRYYITVYVYDWRPYQERMPVLKDFGFSPSVQFKEGEYYNTVDIDYHTDDATTVLNIEDFFKTMWKTLGEPYYERYQND